MAFMLIAFAACLAVSSASVSPYEGLAYSAPVVTKTVVDTEYDPNPQYTYSYGVQDALTGDSKSQVESRSGDVVNGQYSLIEPDGSKRTVDYAADPVNGFNAVVSRTPGVAPVVAKVAAPVVAAAPAVTSYTSSVVAAPAVAAAPVVAKVAAAPAVTSYSSSVVSAGPAVAAYAAPAVAAYSAPAVAYSAPAVAGYSAYAAPAVAAYSGPAVAAYSAPAVAAYSAPAVAAYAAPAAYSSYSVGPATKTVVQGPSAVSYTSSPVLAARVAAPLAYSSYGAPVAKVW
ncbi:hypothetical protein Trydic_g4914 [Trypoxylus dichotomus]